MDDLTPEPAAHLLGAAVAPGAVRTTGIVYVSWAPHCSRSDHTARELGGRSYMIYAAWLGSRPATIALKYAVQWWQTSRLLRRTRPQTVFVMSPPIFAALPALWYARRTGARVVVDAHTCAFVLPRWQRFQALQRWVCRRAATTLVTNRHIGALVRAAGAHATIVPDVPVVFPRVEPFERDERFTVAVVCSFAGDEPLAAIWAAAALVPHVRFHVTGDAGLLSADLRSRMPPNLSLTGFLETARYAGLIRDADAVLDLTTEDHTMLRGAFEALYQGVPVVVSDWPILQEAFPLGAVHVPNTPAGIAEGIDRMQRELPAFRAGAARQREVMHARWEDVRREILGRIDVGGEPEHLRRSITTAP